MRKIIFFVFLLILVSGINTVNAQEKAEPQDSIEVYIMDSFVTPEVPHTFMLSFFTSARCKSKVKIDGKYEYTVSGKLTENHSTKIDISDLNFRSKDVPFVILVEDSLGHIFKSERYDITMPTEIKVKSESNFLLLCLFGGAVFAIPSPTYVLTKDNQYFSLTKEIPLFSIRSKSFNYPEGYFSVEYSYIFKAREHNFFRIGYKHIINVPGIQFISPGINWFTNFKGFNGISPEISIGWMKLFNVFTLYSRYRYNFQPGKSAKDFQEISIGVYSSFFSVYF